MDINAFIEKYAHLVQENVRLDQRIGQASFNAVYALDPELADMVRGRYGIDPFYKDALLKDFELEIFGTVIYGKV